jgi:hypothetical protein
MSEQKGCLYGDLTALGAGGAMLALLNPEGADLLITNFVVRSTVVSTGAATIDAGVHATGLTNDELIDGLDINAALVCESNHDQVTAGTVAEHEVVWGSTSYLVCFGSAATTGFVGKYYVEYIRL